MADEIIQELWDIKDDIAGEFGNDLHALVAHLLAKKPETDRTVANLQSLGKDTEQSDQANINDSGIV